MDGEAGYSYANLANEWPGFDLSDTRLELREGGSLSLATVQDNGFASRAVLMGGPFRANPSPPPFVRIRVDADSLPPEAHLQLFAFLGEPAPFFDPAMENPFGEPGWHKAPLDILDVFVANPDDLPLWIGASIFGNQQTTPVVHQIRIDFGRESYLDYLPAIFSKVEDQRILLEALLGLHQSILGGLEEKIDDLPVLFDPFAAPSGDYPSWLSWLAGWLAFDLSEAWSDTEARNNLSEAFELYGKRGTVEGLRRYLKLYAGVEAHILEPGLHTAVWSLGQKSLLGFDTMLAPAHPQGAVLDTTAVLDQSYLTDGEDFGALLFEDLAYRFCVQVYCAELARPGALEDVLAVLEREKPAHTDYNLCVIEPRMRVGVQARVGIDSIVGEEPPTARFGMVLGTGVLPASAPECETEPVSREGDLSPCPEREEN